MSASAAILLIGDEILFGRTQDKNVNYIARLLFQKGIDLKEVRIIGDTQVQIVEAVNELRLSFDYLFTTGGIGSTHDDITTESIALAFGVPIEVNQQAFACLKSHYEKKSIEFNKARQKMAQIPKGACLIENKISIAPGYQLENVYVMAGIPKIMQSMFAAVLPRLKTGKTMTSITIESPLGEGEISDDLSLLQQEYCDVIIGSYPFFLDDGGFGVNIVVRGIDSGKVELVSDKIRHLLSLRSE